MRVVLLLVLVFGWCALIRSGELTESVKTRQLVGRVETRSTEGAAWRAVRPGMLIRSGWDLRTYVESSVEFELAGGSLVRLGENTVVTITRAMFDSAGKTSASTVTVGTGRVWANVKKLADTQSRFEVVTPTAVASIRGTRLGVSVGQGGTAVDVFTGLVMVRSRGVGQDVPVSGGMRASIQSGNSPVRTFTFEQVRDSGVGGESVVDVYSDSSNAGGATDTIVPARGGEDQSNRTEDSTNDGAGQLFLTVVSPRADQVITEPMVQVIGATNPGAEVLINDNSVTVESQGRFGTRIALPDEAQRYPVTVIARLGGKQMQQNIWVDYRPVQIPLMLEITSPAQGQKIGTRLFRVMGKTSPGAAVTINGRPVIVGAGGAISAELPVTEEHVSGLLFEITAENGREEKSRTITVVGDISSPAVNTSAPVVVVQGQGRVASRTRTMQVSVSDRTPEDRITLMIENNGITEEFLLENRVRQDFPLEEGRNVYRIRAMDRARNLSNVVSGQIYFLPRVPVIEIIEPPVSYRVYSDLPPLPRGVPRHSMTVEVEIDDGIGDVPESIRFVRIGSARGETLLQSRGKYRYSGRVVVERGLNTFQVTAEDMAGNVGTRSFEVMLK